MSSPAGIAPQELIPDIEAHRHVPHALQEGKKPIRLGQEGRQAGRGPQAQDRVVVVDEGDLPVPHVDVAGHLDEGRLRRRHHAERVAHGTPLPRHHPEEEIGRAGLITLQDGLGQQAEGFVVTDLVSGQKHRCSPLPVVRCDTEPRVPSAPRV